MTNTEKEFQDLFITAGYSTAFGAALGAAAMGLQKHPEENTQFIAIGASAGFIAGSVLGTYLIVGPAFMDGNPNRVMASATIRW